tara:strand:- start:503 stop:748 length:246 start_codon:yes stop_codon:yes gene_type:complete
MKKVKFTYVKDDVVFGQYDIMFPQTNDVKECSHSFDGDIELKEYINHFAHWLTKIGFSKDEIRSQISHYCNFEDEISFEVR